MSLILDGVFLTLAVALALRAIRQERILSAIVTLGAFGFVVALIWANLGAVDVAFIEVVVGAGASTIFLLAALNHMGERESVVKASDGTFLTKVLLGLLVLVIWQANMDLSPFGRSDSPPATHVSPRYIDKALEEVHSPNLVTAVLGDYRGFDTLMETAVIFTAALAILLVVGKDHRKPAP